ncbi:hypothetical protein ACHAQI_011221 [Fusarium lateritium]
MEFQEQRLTETESSSPTGNLQIKLLPDEKSQHPVQMAKHEEVSNLNHIFLPGASGFSATTETTRNLLLLLSISSLVPILLYYFFLSSGIAFILICSVIWTFAAERVCQGINALPFMPKLIAALCAPLDDVESDLDIPHKVIRQHGLEDMIAHFKPEYKGAALEIDMGFLRLQQSPWETVDQYIRRLTVDPLNSRYLLGVLSLGKAVRVHEATGQKKKVVSVLQRAQYCISAFTAELDKDSSRGLLKRLLNDDAEGFYINLKVLMRVDWSSYELPSTDLFGSAVV